MLPGLPCHKDDKRVEALSQLLRNTVNSPLPPRTEPEVWSRRCQISQAQVLENYMPNLPCEDATDQDVLNRFLFLVTKNTGLRVGQSSLCKPIRGPASVVDRQPNKEAAAQRRPGLPNSFPMAKLDGAKEKRVVSRFAAIVARLSELRIRNILLQLHTVHLIPKPKIFG